MRFAVPKHSLFPQVHLQIVLFHPDIDACYLETVWLVPFSNPHTFRLLVGVLVSIFENQMGLYGCIPGLEYMYMMRSIFFPLWKVPSFFDSIFSSRFIPN